MPLKTKLQIMIGTPIAFCAALVMTMHAIWRFELIDRDLAVKINESLGIVALCVFASIGVFCIIYFFPPLQAQIEEDENRRKFEDRQ